MGTFQTIYGEFVEIDDDLLGIIEEIRYRWPALRVVTLDMDAHHDIFDAPFRILELCHDGVERKVMDVWKMDRTVIDKLHQMATVDLDKLVADQNAKATKVRDDKFKEALGAANDVVAHALHHPGTSYSFKDSEGDLVTISDSDKTKRRSEGRKHL